MWVRARSGYPNNQRICAAKTRQATPGSWPMRNTRARPWSGVYRAILASRCWRAAGKAPSHNHVAPRAWWAMTASAGSSVRCATRSNVSPISRAVSTVTVQDKTATAHTGPGPALTSRPPADITRRPGCRRAPPLALRQIDVNIPGGNSSSSSATVKAAYVENAGPSYPLKTYQGHHDSTK